jgi:hypothetical protein
MLCKDVILQIEVIFIQNVLIKVNFIDFDSDQ